MNRQIVAEFRKLGARVKVHNGWGLSRGATRVSIDIQTDPAGEYFVLRHGPGVTLDVPDVQPSDRHLLLTARAEGDDVPAKFLCGRDEFHWFVAAVPELGVTVRTVQDAKDALKPEEVWESMRQFNVPQEDRDLRRTDGFVRQGEWFFLPRPWLKVEPIHVLRNEPIRRGAGKAHWCQYLYRLDGVPVRVCEKYPNGLTDAEFLDLPITERESHRWSRMVRDATVYVRGQVTHPDHKPVYFGYWHQVVMNTEARARASEQVAFLD